MQAEQTTAYIPNKFIKQAVKSFNAQNKTKFTDNDVLTGKNIDSNSKGAIMENALSIFANTSQGKQYFQAHQLRGRATSLKTGQLFGTGAPGGSASQYAADAVAERLALEVKSGEYTNFDLLMKNFRVPAGFPLVDNLSAQIKNSSNFRKMSGPMQAHESRAIDDLVRNHKSQVKVETEKVFDQMAGNDPAFRKILQDLGYNDPTRRNDVLRMLTGGAAGGFVPNFLRGYTGSPAYGSRGTGRQRYSAAGMAKTSSNQPLYDWVRHSDEIYRLIESQGARGFGQTEIANNLASRFGGGMSAWVNRLTGQRGGKGVMQMKDYLSAYGKYGPIPASMGSKEAGNPWVP